MLVTYTRTRSYMIIQVNIKLSRSWTFYEKTYDFQVRFEYRIGMQYMCMQVPALSNEIIKDVRFIRKL